MPSDIDQEQALQLKVCSGHACGLLLCSCCEFRLAHLLCHVNLLWLGTCPTQKIHAAITKGALAFLWAEYRFMALFIVVFGIVVLVLVGSGSNDYTHGVFAAIAFVCGSSTSIVSGYIGMRIATYVAAFVWYLVM